MAKKKKDRAEVIREDLALCHAAVWTFRLRPEVEVAWPTPDEGDALRFAFCEAAEALDAQLRLNLTYARNNEKELSVEDELVDCAIMLYTAWGPRWPGERDLGIHRQLLAYTMFHEGRVETIGYCCGEMLAANTGVQGEYGTTVWCWIDLTLRLLLNYPDLNLRERIESRLAQIEGKHLIG